jgi:uncharacterized membrane protein
MANKRRDRRIVPPPALVVRPDLVVAGLAVAGAGVAAYLTWLKLAGVGAVFCVSGTGCDIVQSSRYAMLLGAPTALWGGLLYVAIGVLAVMGLSPGRWRWAFHLAAAGVAFSAYLTALSVFVIRASCMYCLVSTGIMAAILGVLVWRRRAMPARGPGLRPSRLLLGGVSAAALTVLAGAFFFAMPSAEAPGYQGALAQHLRDTGAVMYGAYWCSHCIEQKTLFGPAAKDLPYVECDAKGVNARPDLCQKVGVKAFPTWLIGDERREGVVSLADLAALSKFRGSVKAGG